MSRDDISRNRRKILLYDLLWSVCFGTLPPSFSFILSEPFLCQSPLFLSCSLVSDSVSFSFGVGRVLEDSLCWMLCSSLRVEGFTVLFAALGLQIGFRTPPVAWSLWKPFPFSPFVLIFVLPVSIRVKSSFLGYM